MPRYIDAEALIEDIKRVYCTDCNNYNEVRCRACGTDDAMAMIEDAPTVEVIVPPCKIGEPVYIAIKKTSRHCKAYAYVRKSKLTYKNMARVISDFGKTVFLSKEEAERVANGREAD
jgi:hypothetical protein